jgi:hypothetical protein
MTDIPPSRYKIVEKDGRLIVYDKGVQVSSGMGKPAAPTQMRAAPVAARAAAAPIRTMSTPGTGDGRLGRLADGTAALLARRRNADGTLVIRRTKKEGLRSRTQEATLTAEQARIYGMSMLNFIPFALGMLLSFFGAGVIGFPLLVLGIPLLAVGAIRMTVLFGKLEWRDAGG